MGMANGYRYRLPGQFQGYLSDRDLRETDYAQMPPPEPDFSHQRENRMNDNHPPHVPNPTTVKALEEAERMAPPAPMSRDRDPLLRWFATAHLQPNLRPMVEAYITLAHQIVRSCDPSPERTLALRDLIASKDNAVRALVETPLKGEEVQV